MKEDLLLKIREKYFDCKNELDRHPFINFFGGNYRRLKKYYNSELRDFESAE